jgi:hypothetical protein
MIVYSMAFFKWNFREALYFAVSSLSTGGHWSIPKDSPDWMFAMTGVFIMFGVPIMALAMSQIAYMVISDYDLDEAHATIDAVVTKDELEFLDDFRMEEFNGTIDRADFIILCMVRMGTDPGLMAYINERFLALGFHTGDPLTVDHITQGQMKYVGGRIRNRASAKGLTVAVKTRSEMEGIDASLSDISLGSDSSDSDSSVRPCDDSSEHPCDDSSDQSLDEESSAKVDLAMRELVSSLKPQKSELPPK